MSLFSGLRILQFKQNLIIPTQYVIQMKGYAVLPSKKVMKKQQFKIEKVELSVEKDINKLLNYVCGLNYYKEGEEVKLKPDSEYPEWLWNIRTEPPKLSDLDPNTKAYWRYIRKQGIIRTNRRIKYHTF
ncbi:39S ribosomal protein L54, mitochondrial [Hylaeus volcanicus]|uniref:39S ribosomal protein L54, mitochondrial n=1 Tax=Hylaeus volcanicus TaxID=313075 RepID=UPI0023B77D78|nr:39S ribosomal protein L54, mitochondrial [Hylaeus volcanicus]